MSAEKAVRWARSPSPQLSTALSWVRAHVAWAWASERSSVLGSSSRWAVVRSSSGLAGVYPTGGVTFTRSITNTSAAPPGMSGGEPCAP